MALVYLFGVISKTSSNWKNDRAMPTTNTLRKVATVLG